MWIRLTTVLLTLLVLLLTWQVLTPEISIAEGNPALPNTPHRKVALSAPQAVNYLYLPFILRGESIQSPPPTTTPGPVISCPAISIPANPTEWTQLNGNPQRTGSVSAEVSTPWRVKWIWNGPANGGDSGAATGHLRLPKNVQPVSGGGRLYVGHSDGIVRAIYETNGTQAWASANLGAAIANTVAYDSTANSIYVGTTAGKFFKLNATNGQTSISVQLNGQIQMAPLLVDGTVYIGTTNGVLYALDKTTLAQTWVYSAGAALIGSTAFSASQGGLIIALAEDSAVHAICASNGARRWRVTVNSDTDARRGNTRFADTYPVVSDANGIVIVRSYLVWDKMWQPTTPPTTLAAIRSFLTQNPTHQSFFALNLANGASKFLAPVMVGAIGNGGDFESVPPQAIVKRLGDGTEVAYLIWRNGQACVTTCDNREDSTIGEMNLTTGDIRFIQDYKKQGNIRLPTDEQSPLSITGNTILHAHWMSLGSIRITDRSATWGSTYANAIRASEVYPVANTLAAGTCSTRSNHYCPVNFTGPGDGSFDPGFYVYYASAPVYDSYWTTPTRSATISNGTIYWKSIDGAITAIAP